MNKYRLLYLAIVAVILAAVMSTTAFCTDMSKTRELVLFEDAGVRVVAPLSAIEKMVERDGIPSDWMLYADEQSILDATNGKIGPLKDDFFRAGVLRYNLQLTISRRKAGATPALAISRDGMQAKFISVIAFGEDIMCDLTTFEFNHHRFWPRYLQIDHKHYLKIAPIGG